MSREIKLILGMGLLWLIGCIVILSLAGCERDETPIKLGSDPAKQGTTVADAGSYSTADVQEITLHDGTRCAVMVGYNKGGISCDWQ